jgi:hypothetical protein
MQYTTAIYAAFTLFYTSIAYSSTVIFAAYQHQGRKYWNPDICI